MTNLTNSIKSLPSKPGVYFFKNSKGVTIYIGKAINLKNRVKSYFQRTSQLPSFTQKMVSEIKYIKIQVLNSEFEALLIEAKLINVQQPYYNIRSKDDKRFLMIAISKDPYPRLYTARKKEDQSLYFGPFPSSTDVKMVLKTIRRIFPYCTCLNAKHLKKKVKNAKPCMYYHLGLCPGCCLGYPKTKYRRTIRKIIRLLNGDTNGLISQLTKEMKEASKKQNYETAQVLKKQIDSLIYITLNWQNLSNENLTMELGMDQYQQTLKEAKQILPQLKNLSRIEGYDISNFFGQEATASMVVLTNLQIDKSQYRRFKIRQPNLPNDPAMMFETIDRRFNHPEWPLPNLIVVDGGKGQLSATFSALRNKKLTSVPLIGLTKNEEIIIKPILSVIPVETEIYNNNVSIDSRFRGNDKDSGSNKDSGSDKGPINGIITGFEEIRLPRNSQLLKIIQWLRDESHRFAKNYHLLLRKKKIMPSY